VIFGAAALSNVDQKTANNALNLAEQAGVNHIDVAPQYGLAEERVGPWLESRRNQYFLGCKTLERQREPSWAQLHESLRKLHTDQLDLYQLHAVNTMDELDAAFADDGAMETLRRARDEGLTRYLGITGHGIDVARVQLDALDRFDFDTVMFPINPVLYANTRYRTEAEELLSVCATRDVGVMIIKSIAKGPWSEDEPKSYTTWYEPYDEQTMIDPGVWFALSQSPVTGVASAGDTRLLPLVLDAANRYHELSEAEQEDLIGKASDLEPLFP
jgi:aryl-alcohol dehydrogenase-like predicted oxidoreductase